MKKIQYLILTLGLVFNVYFGNAQNNIAAANDWGRISFKPVVPEQVESISPEVSNLLSTMMTDIVTSQGLAGSGLNNRFIIVPNIVVLNRNVVTNGETFFVLNLRVNFVTGDGVEGIKFSMSSKEVKGSGRTETKAYIDAIRKIKSDDPVFQQMISDSKTKLIAYYNAKCNLILKNAETLAGQNNLDQAIYELSMIPDVCADCYKRASDLAVKLYLAAQERNCKIKLNQAQNTWAANPNEQGAQEAAELLNGIDPNTSCFNNAKGLIAKINGSIKSKLSSIEAFNRKVTLMRENNEFELNKERIKAARDIAVAYYQNQPTTIIYSYRSWW